MTDGPFRRTQSTGEIRCPLAQHANQLLLLLQPRTTCGTAFAGIHVIPGPGDGPSTTVAMIGLERQNSRKASKHQHGGCYRIQVFFPSSRTPGVIDYRSWIFVCFQSSRTGRETVGPLDLYEKRDTSIRTSNEVRKSQTTPPISTDVNAFVVSRYTVQEGASARVAVLATDVDCSSKGG